MIRFVRWLAVSLLALAVGAAGALILNGCDGLTPGTGGTVNKPQYYVYEGGTLIINGGDNNANKIDNSITNPPQEEG